MLTPVTTDPTYESFGDFLKDMDSPDPVSTSFKEELTHFKARIDELEREPSDTEVQSLLEYLGPNCSLPLLKKVKAVYEGRLSEIERVILPNLFSSEGVASVDFEDGSSVNIDVAYESKTVDRNKAISWLIESGHGDAVRDTLDFLPGSLDDAAFSYLQDHGYSFTFDKTVNGQTLKKIVKDILNSGGELPPADAIKFKAEKVAVFKYPKKGF